MDYTVRPIGRVESPLTSRDQAPKQEHEGAPPAVVVIDAEFVEGLSGLRVGDTIILITWLDRTERDVLRVRPRSRPTGPLQGVFNTRSPDRPNPIGLHNVEISSIDGQRLGVRSLEALDGTPVVDIKPARRRS